MRTALGLAAFLWGLAFAESGFLVSIMKELAVKAGYSLRVEAPPLTLLEEVPYPEEEDPLAALTRLVAEKLGPGYAMEVKEGVVEIAPATRVGEAEEGGAERGSGLELLLLLPSGSTSSRVDSLEVGSLVQEVRAPSEVLELTLYPNELTCLAASGEAVCLRPLFFSGEGTVPVDLGGSKYTVKYKVSSPPPTARVVSLDGTYPSGTFVLKPSPSPLLSALPGGDKPAPFPRGLWLGGKADEVWERFSLAKVPQLPPGNWYYLAKFCNLGNLKRALQEVAAEGLSWAVRSEGECPVVLLEGKRGAAFVARKGIPVVKAR